VCALSKMFAFVSKFGDGGDESILWLSFAQQNTSSVAIHEKNDQDLRSRCCSVEGESIRLQLQSKRSWVRSPILTIFKKSFHDCSSHNHSSKWNRTLDLEFSEPDRGLTSSGLPDFSRYIISKRGQILQITTYIALSF
jgi:hypothetical protein